MSRTRDWDSIFMDLAFFWANQTRCVRRGVGAVAVRDNRVLVSGYNGQIGGHEHCTKENCYRTVNNIPSGTLLHLCKALHAEVNLVIQAATSGISLTGCAVYCTTMPCENCMKLLLGLGLKAIYFAESYNLDGIRMYLEEEARVTSRVPCKIFQMTRVEDDNEKYWVSKEVEL